MNPNKIKTKRFEDYEDSLWKVIMHKYSEEEGKELSEEIATLKDDTQYQPTDAEKIKYYKMLDGELRKQKLRSIGKTSKKILTRVAVVVLVFILGFSILFTTVEAFRVQVLNFIMTFEKEYTTVKLGESENDGNIIAGFKDTYVPIYIPAGYKINQLIDEDDMKTIEYINDEDNFLFFYDYNQSAITNIDTEDADTIKSIKINGVDGLFVLKNNRIIISWTYNNRILIIIAYKLTEEETIKIAESVIYIE